MIAIFSLYSILVLLVFGQAKVLATQHQSMSNKQISRTSVMVNIGWLITFIGFIFLGISYSWMVSIFALLTGILIYPMLLSLFPFIYLLSPFWPIVVLIIAYLEFF
jgi:divalent metal cation (Fe/Co/Zn/Cd) transporter